jgi:hypothetical protein
MILSKEQLNRGTGLMPGEEHRRSQRVIIRVPITLVATEKGQPVKITAHTVAVNVHGAMVMCPRMLDPETKVELVNGRTAEKVGSKVSRAPRESAEGFLIPVEFTTPSPNFWQISFPPVNWKVPES